MTPPSPRCAGQSGSGAGGPAQPPGQVASVCMSFFISRLLYTYNMYSTCRVVGLLTTTGGTYIHVPGTYSEPHPETAARGILRDSGTHVISPPYTSFRHQLFTRQKQEEAISNQLISLAIYNASIGNVVQTNHHTHQLHVWHDY